MRVLGGFGARFMGGGLGGGYEWDGVRVLFVVCIGRRCKKEI